MEYMYLEAEVKRAGSQLLPILLDEGVECTILIETQYSALDSPVLGLSISPFSTLFSPKERKMHVTALPREPGVCNSSHNRTPLRYTSIVSQMTPFETRLLCEASRSFLYSHLLTAKQIAGI